MTEAAMMNGLLRRILTQRFMVVVLNNGFNRWGRNEFFTMIRTDFRFAIEFRR
jgi:hypothetical protein